MKRFEEVLAGWQSSRLSQSEAALLLGVCGRTFHRQIARYEADGLEGLLDKGIRQASHRPAPVDEVTQAAPANAEATLLRQVKVCGLAKVDLCFVLAITCYNLVRLQTPGLLRPACVQTVGMA